MHCHQQCRTQGEVHDLFTKIPLLERYRVTYFPGRVEAVARETTKSVTHGLNSARASGSAPKKGSDVWYFFVAWCMDLAEPSVDASNAARQNAVLDDAGELVGCRH